MNVSVNRARLWLAVVPDAGDFVSILAFVGRKRSAENWLEVHESLYYALDHNGLRYQGMEEEGLIDIVSCDVLLVGGGNAGLRAAIPAAETFPTLSVALISKLSCSQSHSLGRARSRRGHQGQGQLR